MSPSSCVNDGEKCLNKSNPDKSKNTSQGKEKERTIERPTPSEGTVSDEELKKAVIYLLSNRPVLSLSQMHRVLTKYYPSLQIGKLEKVILELLIKEEIQELSADEFTLI